MNQNHATFDAVLSQFLGEAKRDKPPASMCLAVAGPVTGNKVRFTNRESWSIDGNAMATSFKIKSVRLINDFVANGYGLLCLDESAECKVLQVQCISAPYYIILSYIIL
jgi:glucokinase